MHTTIPTSQRRPTGQVMQYMAGLIAVLATIMIAAGCGSTERVCEGRPENVVLLPSTGGANLATARAMIPQIAAQAIDRAASSCGRLLVGLQDSHPEADESIQIEQFIPLSQTAYNRRPQITRMVAEGTAFVQRYLLAPLAAAAPSTGDPTLGGLVKLGSELDAHDAAPATIILINDGLDVEPAPDGSSIDVRTATGTAAIRQLERRMREFVPELQASLTGSCVMLVGAGATSTLPDSTLLASQALLGQVLAAAHVHFVATRSPDLPSTCDGVEGLVITHPRPQTVVATLHSDVVFQVDSATLQPGAQSDLQQLIPPLRDAHGAIQVVGYTDNTGTDAINDPLSRARAAAVATWIEAQASIPPGRIRTEGLGSADPTASNATPAGRALNRRVVITIHMN